MKNTVHRWLSPVAGPEARRTHRDAGDAARDMREWTKAEEAYRSHLDAKPEDAEIWVQYGHALKEQNKLSEAEAAYRTSLSLSPDNADSHLQLGHALKLQRRLGEAAESYERSLELKPTKTAFDELQFCGRKPTDLAISSMSRKSIAQDTTFFEVDDLLGYLSAHSTLSGIQRVQVGILQCLLAADGSEDTSNHVFVRSRADGAVFWQLDAGYLKTLVDYCISEHVERNFITTLLAQLEQSAVSVQPSRGQCYFIMGAFWGFNGDATRYMKLKAAGVSVGVYIYDLIPLSHPEYCDAHLVSDFALSLGDGLAVFDFVLTISEYTAKEMRKYISRHGLREIPVQAVILAHVLTDNKVSAARPLTQWTRSIQFLRDQPFVLSVSTIEGRKNHAYLISIWKMLLQEGLDLPHLVFVGRQGWRVNDLMEQLRATDYLNGYVHILHDLSDAELETLYDKCLFTAFPSFVEGWGLPVGESLTHRKVCVASDTSSIPEVGGDLVDYVDPYNTRSGIEVFRKLIVNHAYRESRQSNIQTRFQPRSWRQVTQDLLKALAEHRSGMQGSWRAPLLRPGEVFRPGDLRLGHTVPANYPSRPIRLILAQGWFTAESFGVWMREPDAVIRFATDLAPGTEIVAYLQLAGSPSHTGALLTISASDDAKASRRVQSFPAQAMLPSITLPVENNKPFSTRLLGKVGASGEVTLNFSVDGIIPFVSATDQRRLSAGLIGLAYAPRSDASVRADIRDSLQLG